MNVIDFTFLPCSSKKYLIGINCFPFKFYCDSLLENLLIIISASDHYFYQPQFSCQMVYSIISSKIFNAAFSQQKIFPCSVFGTVCWLLLMNWIHRWEPVITSFLNYIKLLLETTWVYKIIDSYKEGKKNSPWWQHLYNSYWY